MSHPDLSSRRLSLRDVLAWGVTNLQAAEIPTARLDAEVLIGSVVGYSRAQVLARAHETITRPQRGRFAALIQRRSHGEPVAYILGRQEFYGRDFLVDRRVLIPRPETEELVDRVLDALVGRPEARVADIGTGSGAIAVTLAAERPDLHLVAVDNSEGALTMARENARRHEVGDRVTFYHGSLLEPLVGQPPFDLLVANLPYIGTNERDLLDASVRDFEPPEALFAGAEGLDLFPPFFEQLLTHPLLKPDGMVLLEIGYAQGSALARMAHHYFPTARAIQVHRDLAHHDRFVELRP